MPGKRVGAESWGQLRKLPSGYWQAQYTHNGVRYPCPSGTFSTKDAARAWLRSERKIIEDVDKEWTPPALRAVVERDKLRWTLRAYAEDWMKHADLRPTTRRDYQSNLNHRILPGLGDIPLVYLDRATVQSWWRNLDKDENPRACDKAFCTLRAILNGAVDEEMITANPATRIKGAGKPSQRRRVAVGPVDSATIWAVSEAMPPRERLAVLLGGFLGLREAEVLDLRWGDVCLDLIRPVISVRHQVIEIKGGMMSTPNTKTENAYRDVPILTPLLPVVREHLQTYCKASGNPLLFTRSDDNPRHLAFSTYRAHVYAAMAAQGLPVGRSGYTVHDLRHVSLTRIPLAGGTDAETKDLGGHSGDNWRRYQEVDPSHLAEVEGNWSAMIAVGRPDRYGPVAS